MASVPPTRFRDTRSDYNARMFPLVALIFKAWNVHGHFELMRLVLEFCATPCAADWRTLTWQCIGDKAAFTMRLTQLRMCCRYWKENHIWRRDERYRGLVNSKTGASIMMLRAFHIYTTKDYLITHGYMEGPDRNDRMYHTAPRFTLRDIDTGARILEFNGRERVVTCKTNIWAYDTFEDVRVIDGTSPVLIVPARPRADMYLSPSGRRLAVIDDYGCRFVDVPTQTEIRRIPRPDTDTTYDLFFVHDDVALLCQSIRSRGAWFTVIDMARDGDIIELAGTGCPHVEAMAPDGLMVTALQPVPDMNVLTCDICIMWPAAWEKPL